MPRNRGTSRASKSGTGIKKDQPARRVISHVKIKSEVQVAAEGGSSAAHALQPDEPALEWWMAHRRDDPWFEKVAACEDAVNAAAHEYNLVAYATRDLAT